MNSAAPVVEQPLQSRHPSTPYLSVDLDLLDANIAWLARYAADHGVGLRPHAKTHKCSAIAHRQIGAGALGVSCATIDEAEVMVGAGIPGILITSPIVGDDKIARYLALVAAAPDTRTVVDDFRMSRALAAALEQRGLTSSVLIDVDVGQHRTGIAPEKATFFGGAVAELAGLRLEGLQAYAGHIQHMSSAAERRGAAAAVGETVKGVRQEMAGLLPERPIVSGGGTGTHDLDAGGGAFTELQAGSYVFMDVEYCDIEPAHAGPWGFRTSLHLHTTVVSAPVDGCVTTDAGTKSIAVNGPPPRIVTPGYEGLRYGFSGDEHGNVTIPTGSESPPVGTRFRCMVSHCDPTVALHDRIYGMRGDAVVDVLSINARGRR